MGACERCLDGRHLRCGGRGDCTCSICAKSTTPRVAAPVSLSTDPNRQRSESLRLAHARARAERRASVTTTMSPELYQQVMAASEMNQHLAEVLQSEQQRRRLSLKELGDECGINERTLGRFFAGKMTQGFTQRSLQMLLDWLATDPPALESSEVAA